MTAATEPAPPPAKAGAAPVLLFLLAGLLPVLAVNGAYAINLIEFTVPACWPYWDGCVSISAGVRSGPGLWLFKAVMLPVAVMLGLAWHRLRQQSGVPPLRGGLLQWVLGVLGAAFLVLYVLNLGLDGASSRFMRRFGVIIYFGASGLALLLVARRVDLAGWYRRRPAGTASPWPARALMSTVALMWGVGVGFSFKRLFGFDPERLDRIESAVEWCFALLMSLSLMALAWVLRSRTAQRQVPAGDHA